MPIPLFSAIAKKGMFMLNVQNIAEFMRLVNGMKKTIEVLEDYGIKAHWNNSKEQIDEAENTETLFCMEEGIKSLFSQLQAVTKWHKNANNPQNSTACPQTKANATSDKWQRLERDLYAMSEQLELAGNEQHEKANTFYIVANQLHALNATGESDAMTEHQKRAFFGVIADDYLLLQCLNEIRQQPKQHTKRNQKGKKRR